MRPTAAARRRSHDRRDCARRACRAGRRRLRRAVAGERFPRLFSFGPPRCQVAIQADIQARALVFWRSGVSAFLRCHTGRTGYPIALTCATHRVDLDGAGGGRDRRTPPVAVDELRQAARLQTAREAEQQEHWRRRAELLGA